MVDIVGRIPLYNIVECENRASSVQVPIILFYFSSVVIRQ